MTREVVVVGGGVIGTCTALELARRGARVTLLERGPELAWGCSAGNAGLICPSHAWPLATPTALRQGLRWMLKPDSPLYLRPRPAVLPWLARYMLSCTTDQAEAGMNVLRELSIASLKMHVELAEAGLDTALVRRGTINAYTSEEAFAVARTEAEHHALIGLESQILDGDEVRKVEPTLTPGVVGAVYYTGEAHCDPLRFVHAVGREAENAGVDVRTRVEVLRFGRRNGRVRTIETTAGEIGVDIVVLAAGAWTPLLARQLGVFVPVEGGKGYHIDLEESDAGPHVPVMLNETRVIATPLPGRLRLAGTLELAGLDLGVDPVRVAAIRRSIGRAVSGLDRRRVVDVWRGLRPCAPDGLPVIGRPAQMENVVIATGHAMMGLVLGPITGRLVGEVLAGDPPSHDLEPLSPDRFQPFGRRVRMWLR